jgi:hypothetical protein
MAVKNLFALVLLITLSACGGGSTSTPTPTAISQPTPAPVPTILTGVFVDSTVEGLNYQTLTQSGRTTAAGEFSYIANETVTFSIGDIEFPEALGSSYVTPLTIFSTEDFTHVAVVNMIRLLQSLDLDGIAENGIEIPEMAHVLASDLTIDFTDANFEVLVQEIVANSGGFYQTLISSDAALLHFQQTLSALNGENTSGCTSSHSKVGFTGSFQTQAHNVSGQATIIDDCTIELSNFDYDGGGPLVYFYGALNEQYDGSAAFSIGNIISGQVYENANITLRLPQGKTLDELHGISVWSADFSVNFGNVEFTAP